MAQTSNIDATNKWAWSTNTGWINFNTSHGSVTVYSDHLEGYAWSENIGWIRLGTYSAGNAHTYFNTTKDNYGINNDGEGNLSGYAWSENSGWIKFDEVFIDPCTGVFGGQAWGENTGRINFAFSDASKKIVTSWRKDTDADGTPDCNESETETETETETEKPSTGGYRFGWGGVLKQGTPIR